MDKEKISMSDLFLLFGCDPKDTKFVASADSEEYLAVVLYLVQRGAFR